MSFAYPRALDRIEYLFSSIENAVLDEVVDAGVIIHENRFTYQLRGLHKVMDLGEYWEQKTGLPIPLGGIAIRRNLSKTVQYQVNTLIQQSIRLSQTHLPDLSDFVTDHAQEMSPEVMRKHIDLYVNEYSIDLGEKGKMAVQKMAETIAGHPIQNLFI
ncbi:1,4-dihydroxy-6-naphtoate synthase [Filimonas sp.]|nr:1,4-dihydroxy-6-naphtoate synthase [Filimonas sp.]